MKQPVTVTLSDDLSDRVRKLAQQRDQEIIALVERILNENLPDSRAGQDWVDLSEPDEAADREMQAYIELHPQLKQKYFGQYVAIYCGKLIDFDDDHSALHVRIHEKYPNEFVWISRVVEEPIPTLYFRSPRLVQDE